MITIVENGLSNALLATALAILITIIAVVAKPKRALLHAAWVVVLLKLISPALVPAPIPGVSLSKLPPAPAIAEPINSRDTNSPNESAESSAAQMASGDFSRSLTQTTLPPDSAHTFPKAESTGPHTVELLEPHPNPNDRNAIAARDLSMAAPEKVATDATSDPASFEEATVAKSRSQQWLPTVVFSIWFGGSIICAIVAFLRIIRFEHQLRSAKPAFQELIQRTEELSRQLGLRRTPQVVLVEGRMSPMLWPIGRRQRVIIPRELYFRLDDSQQDALIAHELIHVRRRDHWVRYLELLTTLLFWWLPTLWWARSQLRRSEEACCDAWFVHTWPDRSRSYADMLVAAVGFLAGMSGRNVPIPASGLGDLQQLRSRLQGILQHSEDPQLKPSMRLAVFIAALVCLPVVTNSIPASSVRLEQENRADESNDTSASVKQKQQLSLASLQSQSSTVSNRSLGGLQPFELGTLFPLEWSGTNDNPIPSVELRFTLGDRGERFRERWVHPRLHAELRLADTADGMPIDQQLLLMLYDESGDPLTGMRIPMAALQVAQRPAKPLLDSILQSNRHWLAPDVAAFPPTTYDFQFADSEKDPANCRLDDETNPHAKRGVTMTLAVDTLVDRPENYHAPVLFEGRLDDRDVIVAVVAGPSFGWVYGNGILHGWRGYSVSTNTQCLLVIDKQTKQPLAERYGDREVRFLDYAEIQPGQFVPMRIVAFGNQKLMYDFRFQILDGSYWLFDRSYYRESTPVAYVENIVIDGRPPDSRVAHVANLSEDQPSTFAWADISDRQIVQDADNPFVREIASTAAPYQSLNYEFLRSNTLMPDGMLRIDLGLSPMLRQSRYWSLSNLTTGSQAAPSTATLLQQNIELPIESIETTTIPYRLDEELAVDIADPLNSKNRIVHLQFRESDEGIISAIPEVVSTAVWSEQMVSIWAVLLDDQHRPVAATSIDRTIRIEADTYSSRKWPLVFGRPSGTASPARAIVGIHSLTIGAPMGSTWGRFYDRSPLFPVELLLANRDRAIIEVGLIELNRNLERKPDEWDQAIEELVPHRERLEQLIGAEQSPRAMALLCRLIGITQDRSLKARIDPFLNHQDAEVQDAAAIGLGLLGDSDGRDRLLRLQQQIDAETGPAYLPAYTHNYTDLTHFKVDLQGALDRTEP